MLAFRTEAGKSANRAPAGAQPLAEDAERLPKARFAVKLAATEQLVRNEMLMDLGMLVNAVALESSIDLSDLPHVRTSVLNYGLPDIGAHWITELTAEPIARELEAALRTFEPRLAPGSLHVERDKKRGTNELSIRFLVHGELICNPVNVPVELVADVELDSQKIIIKRL